MGKNTVDTERRKEIRRDEMGADALGGISGGPGEIGFTLAKNFGEIGIAGCAGAKVVGKIPGDEVVRVNLDDADQGFRVSDRQRAEQERIDDRKNERVRADAG